MQINCLTFQRGFLIESRRKELITVIKINIKLFPTNVKNKTMSINNHDTIMVIALRLSNNFMICLYFHIYTSAIIWRKTTWKANYDLYTV